MSGHEQVVTREELYRALSENRAQIERAIDRSQENLGGRLDETNAHLRMLNGRVGKGETETAVLHQQVKVLNHEVFPAGRRRGERATDDIPAVPEQLPVRQEVSDQQIKLIVRVALFAIGATTTFWFIVAKVAPGLFEAIRQFGSAP